MFGRWFSSKEPKLIPVDERVYIRFTPQDDITFQELVGILKNSVLWSCLYTTRRIFDEEMPADHKRHFSEMK